MKLLLLIGALFTLGLLSAQTNISITNQEAEQVVLGNYNPANYPGLNVVSNHDDVICNLQDQLSVDSMYSYLVDLQSFYTRHTYSDTLSDSTGIGAARRWALNKIQGFSDAGPGRLIPAYLQFDYLGGQCGDGFGWKNVLGVLPGASLENPSIIIIEAHMDSRCEVSCDSACYAPGMEDNASGTALVLELARVMSLFTYDHTIVFMLTVGEEEGLYGAEAMADYCLTNGVEIKGVLNNDIVGGIECGSTSSPPSCPGLGDIDSTQVRIFSSGGTTTNSRNLARTVKMYYDEKIIDVVNIPMTISVMNQEDRSGRGGDHIPFRANGYSAIRFTSANEHGDANVSDPSYSDRQHTSNDVLGLDANNDGIYEQLYVNLNYLRRNAVINGSSAALLASGPETPEYTLLDEPSGLRVEIQEQPDFSEYRIALRFNSTNVPFDEVYRTDSTSFLIPGQSASTVRFVSVASIDHEKIMSPFSGESIAVSDTDVPAAPQDDLPYGIDCTLAGLSEFEIQNLPTYGLSCYPNPWKNATTVSIRVRDGGALNQEAYLVLRDLQGRIHLQQAITLDSEEIEVNVDESLKSGVYTYTLIVNNAIMDTQRMVKLND